MVHTKGFSCLTQRLLEKKRIKGLDAAICLELMLEVPGKGWTYSRKLERCEARHIHVSQSATSRTLLTLIHNLYAPLTLH